MVVIGHQVGESVFSGFQLTNGSGGTFRSWGNLGNQTSHFFGISGASQIYAMSTFSNGSSVVDANFTGTLEEDIISLSSGCKGSHPVQLGETDSSGSFHIISKVVA